MWLLLLTTVFVGELNAGWLCGDTGPPLSLSYSTTYRNHSVTTWLTVESTNAFKPQDTVYWTFTKDRLDEQQVAANSGRGAVERARGGKSHVDAQQSAVVSRNRIVGNLLTGARPAVAVPRATEQGSRDTAISPPVVSAVAPPQPALPQWYIGQDVTGQRWQSTDRNALAAFIVEQNRRYQFNQYSPYVNYNYFAIPRQRFRYVCTSGACYQVE